MQKSRDVDYLNAHETQGRGSREDKEQKGARERIKNRKLRGENETSLTLTPGEMSGNALREKANQHLERDHWGGKEKKQEAVKLP